MWLLVILYFLFFISACNSHQSLGDLCCWTILGLVVFQLDYFRANVLKLQSKYNNIFLKD